MYEVLEETMINVLNMKINVSNTVHYTKTKDINKIKL